jgi:hypothetical protein
VCEQREGVRYAKRQIDQRCEFLAFGIGKFQPLGAHDRFSDD